MDEKKIMNEENNQQKTENVENTNNNPSTSENGKKPINKKAILISIIAVVSALAIILTTIGVVHSCAPKDVISTTAAAKATAAMTTEYQEYFTPKWEESDNEKGEGYSAIGGCFGQYDVEKFEVSENYKSIAATDLAVYNMAKLKVSSDELKKHLETICNLFGAKKTEKSYDDGEKYYEYLTKSGSELYFDEEYYKKNDNIRCYKSDKEVIDFKKKYIKYSLTDLKNNGKTVAQKYADALSKDYGTTFKYTDYIENSYTMSYQTDRFYDDGKEWPIYSSAELKVYTFRFSTKNSTRRLDADGFEATLVNCGYEIGQKYEDTVNQYLEITVLPDLTVANINNYIVDNTFKKGETSKMFTVNQLDNYSLFADSIVPFYSDTENDTVIFDSVKSIYYDVSYRVDGECRPYALLTFHLKSDPNTEYEAGVPVDSIRENISTFDSVSNYIEEKYAYGGGEAQTEYDVTDVSLAEDFGFKDYDGNTYELPYFYIINQNKNASKIKGDFEKYLGKKTRFDTQSEGRGNYCYYNDAQYVLEYNDFTGIFTYDYFYSENQAKSYIDKYKNKLMNVNDMREKAKTVAKAFENVTGSLKYVKTTPFYDTVYTNAKEYNVSAYCFEFTNEFSDRTITDNESTFTPCYSNETFSSTRFYVVVMPDMTVKKIYNMTNQGFTKGPQYVFNQKDVLEQYISSTTKNDSAVFQRVSVSSYCMDVMHDCFYIETSLTYKLKSDPDDFGYNSTMDLWYEVPKATSTQKTITQKPTTTVTTASPTTAETSSTELTTTTE